MTTAEASKLLAKLAETAGKLNAASNSIKETIDFYESSLRVLNVGLEVWHAEPLTTTVYAVPDEDESSDDYVPGRLAVYLGYAKSESKWSLQVRTVAERRLDGNGYRYYEWEEVEDQGTVELSKAARHIRVAALERIPDLLEQLERAAAEAVESIERAQALTSTMPVPSVTPS